MMAQRLGLVGGWLLLLAVAGCDSCKREPEVVPFGRDRATEPKDEDAERPSTGFETRSGVTLDPGTRDITVAGGRYTTPRGAIHLALRLDLDADDDEDAILLVSHESTLTVIAVKNDRGLLASESLGTFEMQEGCAFLDGKLDQVAPEHVILGLRARCDLGEASAGAMISLLPSPRMRKKLWLDAPTSDAQVPMSLAFSGEDRDEDGHVDLAVAVLGESTPPVELVWLNRPGGLSLTDSELRQALESAYGAARDARSPDVILTEVARLRALAAALCREAKMSRLRVDEAYGVPCGRDFVSLADAISVRAMVSAGRFDVAIQLDRRLREQAEREVLDALDQAWASVKSAKLDMTKIADAPQDGGVDEWTAGLSFTEDGALIRRGLLTQRHTLDGKGADPEVVLDRGLPITDLAGRHAVERLVRDCASVRARIISLDPETGAVQTSGSRREVEIAPPDPQCDRGERAPRTWEILGWTPQGLVARHGARRRVIPLNYDAEPSGDPFDLAEDEPLPSPIHGALVTRDGSTQLASVPGAILVTREGKSPLVVRDEAWGASPSIRSASISRDGKRLAILVDEALYLTTLPSS